ncbi:acetyl-CoA carboxylase carboxyltransferase subunit alpha [Candidatus Acetothermia bacterium]|nr:acetyl-CoA carboxylase carboxyltransferase subunit alpha [Candidatus Acetothermia bacterium]MBI3642904.1 acetyl-CoA carboxylase carboxyltransferase subunit alpha [Candidatus Acetothermia bacterium]
MDSRPSVNDLKKKIEELKRLSKETGLDYSAEIESLEQLESQVRSLLPKPDKPAEDDWEKVKLARHPKRPYTLDYLNRIMEDYYELRGDRMYGNDNAVIAAIAKLAGHSVVVIGHQKGRTAEENRLRNFGMPHPEGYRKVQRVLDLAERFGFPVISLIDTQGAFPGVGAEERHIGGAIAQTIYKLCQLHVPIIVVVIGEGGSGGALAIGVGDRVLMMENSIYSVISPEGCASILWREREKAPEAARAMKISPKHLLKLGVIDAIISEPPGGAQTNHDEAAKNLKAALLAHLDEVNSVGIDKLLKQRHKRLQALGVFEELSAVAKPAAPAEGG